MRRNETYNQAVEGDEGFIPGEGYPSCDGQPCVNMAEQGEPMTDTMAGEQPLGTVEGAPGSDSQYAAADGSQPRTEAEEERAENVNIGISVQKGNTALKDAIDAVLSTMTEDDFNTLMDEAIAVQPEV